MKVGVRTIHFLTQHVATENIKQNMLTHTQRNCPESARMISTRYTTTVIKIKENELNAMHICTLAVDAHLYMQCTFVNLHQHQ